MTGFAVTRLDDLERLPVVGQGLTWLPIRRPLGISAFGVNAYTAARPGDRVLEEHTEGRNRHEELYVVVSGRAAFTLGDDEVDAPAGTLVFLPDPDLRRGAVAAEPDTTVVALGARPGHPHRPSAWETYFAAYAYADTGDAERGLRLLREAVDREPANAAFRYHLACLESRTGNREEALAQLVRAVELEPDVARWAADDADLDAIRDDPRFPTPAPTGTG